MAQRPLARLRRARHGALRPGAPPGSTTPPESCPPLPRCCAAAFCCCAANPAADPMAPAQLDAFGISGFPCLTAPPEPQFGWHRDSFALSQDYSEYPEGGFSGAGRTYRPPLGANMLCYLQDMTAASGPLRVVPRSHLGSPPTPLEADAVCLAPPARCACRARPEMAAGFDAGGVAELVLDLKAGDLVFIHSDLVSPTPRLFVSDRPKMLAARSTRARRTHPPTERSACTPPPTSAGCPCPTGTTLLRLASSDTSSRPRAAVTNAC